MVSNPHMAVHNCLSVYNSSSGDLLTFLGFYMHVIHTHTHTHTERERERDTHTHTRTHTHTYNQACRHIYT